MAAREVLSMSKKSAAVGRLASAKAVEAAVTNALITIAISLTAPLPQFGRVISSPSARSLQSQARTIGVFDWPAADNINNLSNLSKLRNSRGLDVGSTT